MRERCHMHSLYVNGKNWGDRNVFELLTGTEPFRIGEGFFGIIDEVRVSKVARYNKGFTPARRFEPDADTIALYHFDEGQGDILKDSSGNNHHGKIIGAKWVRAEATPNDAPPPVVVKKAPIEAKLSLAQVLTSPDYEWSAPENLGPGSNTDGVQELCGMTDDERTVLFLRKGSLIISRRKSKTNHSRGRAFARLDQQRL